MIYFLFNYFKKMDKLLIKSSLITLISGVLAWGIHFLSMFLGMPERTSSIITFYIIGSFISYILDIIFVRSNTCNWLLKSFLSGVFFRFIIIVILDTVVAITLFHYLLEILDNMKFHFPYRDTICSAIVSVITFFLYTNTLRFDWAYQENPSPVINIMVLSLTVIALMIFANTSKRR